MKGPKDSKESHTSVTMEGTGDTGRGMQGGGRILLCARVNYRALFVPGAGGEGSKGGSQAALWDAGGVRQPPSPCPALLPVRSGRSAAAAGLSCCDGCAGPGLPWKSSSLSGSAVTAPTVRRGGRLRFWGAGRERCRGVCAAGGVEAAVVLCRMKLGASLFQARLNHLGSGTRSHALAVPSGHGWCR